MTGLLPRVARLSPARSAPETVSPAHAETAWWAIGGSPGFVAAVVVFGLAVLLRQFLRAHSYWYDESYLLLNVFSRSHAELIGPLGWNQVAPPGYLLLLRSLFEAFGPSETAMRLPAFLAAGAAILLFVPLARRVLGPVAGGWAVAAFALCPHALTHACEVKPYSIDLFFSVATALAALTICRAEKGVPKGACLGLAACAILGPWFSFTSLFGITAAGAALFVNAARRRSWRGLFFALGVGFVAYASTFAVWWLAARHHACEYLSQYWASYLFPTSASLPGVAAWFWRCLTSTAVYTSPDLGPLVVLLACLGAVTFVRRQAALAVLLVGPVALGLLAAALGKYPMGERLTFFVAPTGLLLTFAGLAKVLAHLPKRLAAVGSILYVVLLVPSLIRDGPVLFRPAGFGEYREAFAWTEAHREPTDVLWISHPEVYAVYHGLDRPVLHALTPQPILLKTCQGRRVWIVTTRDTSGNGEAYGATDALRRAGFREARRERFRSLDVMEFEPPTQP